jgi:hypothetical protein
MLPCPDVDCNPALALQFNIIQTLTWRAGHLSIPKHIKHEETEAEEVGDNPGDIPARQVVETAH